MSVDTVAVCTLAFIALMSFLVFIVSMWSMWSMRTHKDNRDERVIQSRNEPHWNKLTYWEQWHYTYDKKRRS